MIVNKDSWHYRLVAATNKIPENGCEYLKTVVRAFTMAIVLLTALVLLVVGLISSSLKFMLISFLFVPIASLVALAYLVGMIDTTAWYFGMFCQKIIYEGSVND